MIAKAKRFFSNTAVQVAIIGLIGIIYTVKGNMTTQAEAETQGKIDTLSMDTQDLQIREAKLDQAVSDIKDSVTEIKSSNDEIRAYYYSEVLPVLNEVKNKNE